jgi:histidinol-phosphate/aromatic aminotransferase/cobyric acid decarboxylase-like protein
MRPDWTQTKLVPCRFNLSNNICIDPWVPKQLPLLDCSSLSTYPDEFPIYQTIGRHHDIGLDQIAIGFGLGELIQRIYLHLQLGTVTVVVPTWPMSHVFLDVENISYRLIEHHDFDQLDFNQLLQPPTDSIYISNPNGVNSYMFSQEQIVDLLRVYRYVIVDESYMEFSRSNQSMLNHVEQHHNLIVLKTLSKSLSMPGLRLGYAVSNRDTIKTLQLCRPSCVAHGVTVQLASIAFRLISGHVNRMIDTRNYIEGKYDTIPSNGNYVLFKGPAPVQDGVLVKEVYPGITRMSLFSRDLIPEILI